MLQQGVMGWKGLRVTALERAGEMSLAQLTVAWHSQPVAVAPAESIH